MAEDTNGGLIDTEPRQDYSLSEYSQALATSDPVKPKPTTPPPVQTFWDKLLHGVDGKSRTAEMLKGVGRGVVNASSELLSTVSEAAKAVPGIDITGTGITTDMVGKAAGAVSKGQAAVGEHFLGQRSDDPLAAFTESATQFMAGWEATGELKLFKGAGFLARLGQGAVVDATMFNPQEAQLAELAARAPTSIAGPLGALLRGTAAVGKAGSVTADDSQLVARLKRAAAGVIPAAVIEGLVASSRLVRAGKALAAGTGDADALAKAAKTVQDVADGTHVAEGQQLTPQSVAAMPDAPKFTDPVEAHQQVESMNAALDARATAGKVDDAAVQNTSDNLTSFIDTKDPKALASLADTDLGISYATTPEESVKIAERLANRWEDATQALIAKHGEVHVEDAMQEVLAGLGEVPRAQSHDVAMALQDQAPGVSMRKMATDYVLKSHSDAVVKLGDVLEARPHDVVAQGEFKTAMQNYFDLRDRFQIRNSDEARGLRFGQERPNLKGSDVQFAGETPPVTEKDVRASVSSAVQDAESAISDIKKNKTDTNAVTAADFSLARARKAVEAARKKIETGDLQFEHDPELAIKRAQDIKKAADAQRADPQALTPEEQAAAAAVKTGTVNPVEELSKMLDAQETRLDAEMAKANMPPRVKTPKETTPVDNLLAADKVAGSPMSAMAQQLENATPEELSALGRIFKMSGGEPRNAAAVTEAAKVTLNATPLRQVLELFTNSLLSGPKTAQTVLSSGALLNTVEPIVRMVAGAGSLNSAMIREGADQLAGAFKYAQENVLVAGQALRDGKGILDPSPQTIAIGSNGSGPLADAANGIGTVVRIPGNVVGAAHEFGKVTGYRSWIYARSLREGRAAGLSGDALTAYTDANLRASFDKNGVAVVPQALAYGQKVSMATPYIPDSFAANLSKFTNNALVAKFVLPFAKISSNVFNYVFDATPGLNMLARRNRDILRAGGEDAAMLHARSVMMSGLYYYGYTKAVQGDITGRGPSDPQLNALWRKDNEPYSVRANAQSPWISYQRFEPLAKGLGFAADYHTISSELGDQHKDAEHMLYAGGQAIINNMTSATYLKGLVEFGSVLASENPTKLQNYLEHLGGSLAVPAAVSTFNSDPVYRDVQDMREAIYSRIPGFSEKIDPLFSWSGEPIMKTPGTWNRNVSIVTRKDGTPTPVEQELLAMKEKLEPFPKQKDNIDLSNRELYDNGKKDVFGQPISPYRRMMELLNDPGDGEQNLRDAVTELVKSPEWKDMSPGADGFPGGERMTAVRRIKTEHERAAWDAMLEEYPKLKTQIDGVTQMKQAAMTDGERGVQQIEQSMGVKRHP